MMKKYYVKPSITIGNMDSTELICNSQAVTSNVGIGYGGVDDNGSVTVESRRQDLWDEDIFE